MADDAVLYKMVGPVLVKQTKSEVASTVTERLKFVNSEMYVHPFKRSTARSAPIGFEERPFVRNPPFSQFWACFHCNWV